MRTSFWILLFGLLAAVAGALTVSLISDRTKHSLRRQTPVVQVVQEWAPAVVNIGTERIVLLRQHPYWGDYGQRFDFFFKQFYQPYRYSALKIPSVGSGVILKKDGLIVTNAHVVHMASKIFVTLQEGTTLEGKAVLVAPEDDLALIEIYPPHPLKAIKLAEPNDLMIGETVIAIGNPLGLENTVTVGVVSGKNRSFNLAGQERLLTDLIQTDAPINPGNSGGALLNLNGELVGINLAVVLNAQNIGFAIPVEKVRRLLAQSEEYLHRR